MTTSSTPPTPEAQPKRMPCRGCTESCPNYAHCDGKPWRQEQLVPEH